MNRLFAATSVFALALGLAACSQGMMGDNSAPAPSAQPSTETPSAAPQGTMGNSMTNTAGNRSNRAGTPNSTPAQPAGNGGLAENNGEGGMSGHQMMHHSRGEMRMAQRELKAQGMYHGRIDGIDGPATHAAVEQFQQKHGMQATGQLDHRTMAALRHNRPHHRMMHHAHHAKHGKMAPSGSMAPSGGTAPGGNAAPSGSMAPSGNAAPSAAPSGSMAPSGTDNAAPNGSSGATPSYNATTPPSAGAPAAPAAPSNSTTTH